MSVLIKGIDMPTEYGICIEIFPDGRVTYEYCHPVIATAIPVPPHGDLKDADALINALQELFDRRNKDAEYTGFRGAAVSWNDVICYIKDAPTIIPTESEGE